MNKLILCVIAIALCGCSKQKPEIELTKEIFSNLSASKVIEVDAVCLDRFGSGHPDQWIRVYPHFFPVKDSNSIGTIINCIKEASLGSEYNSKKILLVDRRGFT